MAIFEIASDRLEVIPATTFQAVGLREREDLRRLLRQQIGVLAPDTLVIDEDHGDGADRSIDLLGVDRSGALVVVDLRRVEEGCAMELHALRCASGVASLTYEQAVESYRGFLARQGADPESARGRLLGFLGWQAPDEERFAYSLRIVLAAPDFSQELGQTVLWLRAQGVDLRCVRMKPYSYGKRLMLEVTQVIPAPEGVVHEAARLHKTSLARLEPPRLRRTPGAPAARQESSAE